MTVLRVDRDNDVVVVRVLGDVDVGTAPQLEKCLQLLSDESVVIVDLELCPYFDSSGFSVLYRTIQEHHVILVMPDNCKIRRLFEIVGSTKIFPIYATEIGALNAARIIVAEPTSRRADTTA